MSEWIPVSERLPKHESVVLVCNDDGKYAICKYRDFDYDTCWNGWNIMYSPYDDDVWSVNEHGEIVAWMPLPEPYSEDTKSPELIRGGAAP